MKENLLFIPSFILTACGDATVQQPNVIVILADDLGYGDVSAYGSKTISTPNIDRLGKEGIRFTNGYATSATSTPSRYALFTGMYPWKEEVKILPGNAKLLIPTDAPTLPKMMQAQGYATGAIGKWHLGMGAGNLDWNKPMSPSANDVGFDYTNLIAATNDRVPTVYIKNGMVVGLEQDDPIQVNYKKNFEGEPTALTHPELLKMDWHHGHNNSIVNQIPRIGFMKGGKNALWVDEDMADYFVDEVEQFIITNKEKPFFLYYGLHQPHVPRAPHSRFVGSTMMGPRGDAIVEADWCVGQLLEHLEENDLLENTLIVFSSDNGPVLQDGYKDQCTQLVGDHKPAGELRGGKYSLYDAGTHVPFFVYWKGEIQPLVSDALVCQMDLFASLAKLVGAEIPQGLDSEEYLDAFLGKSPNGRSNLIVEAQGKLAYRKGNYVMIPPYKGSVTNITGNELGHLNEYGLFDLKNDVSQVENIANQEFGVLELMKQEFKELTKGF